MRAKMGYKLFFTTTSSRDHITSEEIVAMLDPQNPEHAKHLRWIADLERDGMRYSYQDYDVLSAAYRAAREARR
jgi:hypothetical protein